MNANDQGAVYMGEEQASVAGTANVNLGTGAQQQQGQGQAKPVDFSNWNVGQDPNAAGSEMLAQLFGNGSSILNPGAKAVTDFIEQATEIMKNLSQSDKMRIGENLTFTAIDNPGAPGSICVMHRLIDGNVFYTVFVMQKTFGKVENQTRNMGNRVIEIDQTAFTYFDNSFKTSVQRILKEQYKQHLSPSGQVLLVATTVVPTNADTSKPEVVRIYIAAAVSQTNAMLNKSRNITAMQIKTHNLLLTGNYKITPDSTYADVTGTPELGDFSIDLVIGTNKKFQQNQFNMNLLDQQRDNQYTLSKVVGYVDFMPRPGVNNRTFPGQFQQPQHQFQYDPIFVITHNATLGSTNNVADDTILTQLLGMVALVPFIQENKYRWVSVFEGFSNENSLSLGDFGYQSNPWLAPNESFVPQSIPTLPTEQISFNRTQGMQTSTSPRTALELATTYVSGNAIIALDCTLGDPLYRIKDTIGNAIEDSPQETQVLGALEAFFEGKDPATGNVYSFTTYWKSLTDAQGRRESIILRGVNGEDTKTILHAGHYNSETGMRDIRSLRLLVALAATKGQNTMLDDFVRNRGFGCYSIESIDASRKNLLSFISNAEITGMTYRYYINPRFIAAIGHFMQVMQVNMNVQGLNDMSVGGFTTNSIVIPNQNLSIQGGNYTFGANGVNASGALNIFGGDVWSL
jgi:hypothetical protein